MSSDIKTEPEIVISFKITCGDSTYDSDDENSKKERAEVCKTVVVKFLNRKLFETHEDNGFDNLINEVNDVLTIKYGKQFYVDDTIEVEKELSADSDFDLYIEE
jgi:hypothetical protein